LSWPNYLFNDTANDSIKYCHEYAVSYLYQIIANGFHNGFLYALLAYSYVLLHQVVPKPNLAHGAFFALSGQVFTLGVTFAYNALIFTFASSFGFGLIASALISFVAVGVFAGRIVPRFAALAPNMMIVSTLALAIVLMEAVRIGADGRDFWLPQIASTPMALGFGASITSIQLYNIITIIAVLVLADMILQLTSAGRIIRAVSQDKTAASLCGINVDRTIILTAATSSVMALTGGLLAVLYFGNMSFGAGLTYGLKVLFIAAAGGFSTPRTAAVAAFMFGEAEALWDGYLPIIWREAFFYSMLSVMLIVKGRA
jgi:branched-chain amino acid transport system permease protein